MFSIYDAFVNALTEAVSGDGKYKRGEKLTSKDLTIDNIPNLYNSKWDLEFTDLVVCENCNSVIPIDVIEKNVRNVDNIQMSWNYSLTEPYEYSEGVEEEYEVCPDCGIGENEDEEFEYYNLSIDRLIGDIDNLKNLDDVAEQGFTQALREYINGVENEKIEESFKLEEDDEDYTNLKDKTKSEMLKYLKKNGLDVDNLVKSGVSLESMKDTIDTMLSDYTSPIISEYEQQFNKGLAWDYDIDNNDIIITINDF